MGRPVKFKTANPKRPRRRAGLWLLLGALALEVLAVMLFARPGAAPAPAPRPSNTPAPTVAAAKAGDLLGVDKVEHLTAAEVVPLIRHNYPSGVPGEGVPITKITYHYRSQVPGGEFVTVYGRAYLPDTGAKDLPVFAFAPGTTGIGDQCAASVEQPAKADWGTYDAHMAAYATQGYAGVTTDYEGMRDPTRLHHYMVGELEGRALLDAVRGLRHLPQAEGRLSGAGVFLAGYSQGGHAAFWGDKISARYAPDVQVAGVVGFGPVMSVKQTLVDVVHGANINWFGPNVLVSYEDYYQQTYPGVVLPGRVATMKADVLAHCIDTDLPYWGHSPAPIYTPNSFRPLKQIPWQRPTLSSIRYSRKTLSARSAPPVPSGSIKALMTMLSWRRRRPPPSRPYAHPVPARYSLWSTLILRITTRCFTVSTTPWPG